MTADTTTGPSTSQQDTPNARDLRAPFVRQADWGIALLLLAVLLATAGHMAHRSAADPLHVLARALLHRSEAISQLTWFDGAVAEKGLEADSVVLVLAPGVFGDDNGRLFPAANLSELHAAAAQVAQDCRAQVAADSGLSSDWTFLRYRECDSNGRVESRSRAQIATIAQGSDSRIDLNAKVVKVRYYMGWTGAILAAGLGGLVILLRLRRRVVRLATAPVSRLKRFYLWTMVLAVLVAAAASGLMVWFFIDHSPYNWTLVGLVEADGSLAAAGVRVPYYLSEFSVKPSVLALIPVIVSALYLFALTRTGVSLLRNHLVGAARRQIDVAGRASERKIAADQVADAADQERMARLTRVDPQDPEIAAIAERIATRARAAREAVSLGAHLERGSDLVQSYEEALAGRQTGRESSGERTERFHSLLVEWAEEGNHSVPDQVVRLPLLAKADLS